MRLSASRSKQEFESVMQAYERSLARPKFLVVKLRNYKIGNGWNIVRVQNETLLPVHGV